jgi:protein gp37
MANTKIEWTAETWNPAVGCSKISAGCQNCYAEVMAKRLQAIGVVGYENGFALTLMPQRLSKPIKKKKPTTYFVNSMSDLFHKDIPELFLNRVFEVMEKTPRHTYQILTKRAERMEQYLKNKKIPPNIWLGITAENKKDGMPRIEILKKIKASIKFISVEPMLEDMGKLNLTGIDWVIIGGESGVKARPMKSEWVINIKKECELQNKAFFFKQWGTWGADGIKRNKKSNGKKLLGKEWIQYPTLLNMGQAYA